MRFMVPLSHVLAFAAGITVVIAIPGPSVLFTISRALTVGRRAALLTVARLLAGQREGGVRSSWVTGCCRGGATTNDLIVA